MPEPTTPTLEPTAPAAGTDPNNPPAPDATSTPDPQNPAGDQPLGEGGKKALDAERTARSNAERELAALRKEIEDSKKTAEQRVADDLKAAQSAAEQATVRAMRYEIAAEAGIPLVLAARLAGSTREELLADAETLKTLIPAGATPPRIPAPDPGQGPRPTDPPSVDDQTYEALYGAQIRK